MIIPDVNFKLVQNRINKLWDPFERNPMIAVFGYTGSGKSYLIRHGILPIRKAARTVVIDIKSARGKTWNGYGTIVRELPKAFNGDGTGEYNQSQYRLVAYSDKDDAKSQIKRALAQIRNEGHCIIVIDDSRKVTEREQLNLGSDVEDLILTGRELGISIVLGAQSPTWAVSAIKDQPGAFFLGSVPMKAKELSEIAGRGTDLIPTLRTIKARSFVYVDTWENGIIGTTTQLTTNDAD